MQERRLSVETVLMHLKAFDEDAQHDPTAAAHSLRIAYLEHIIKQGEVFEKEREKGRN